MAFNIVTVIFRDAAPVLLKQHITVLFLCFLPQQQVCCVRDADEQQTGVGLGGNIALHPLPGLHLPPRSIPRQIKLAPAKHLRDPTPACFPI